MTVRTCLYCKTDTEIEYEFEWLCVRCNRKTPK
jgi:hypothetical protein